MDLIQWSGGRDFLAKSIFHVFQIHFFTEIVDSNSLVKNLTFIMGLWETAWGKMSVMTAGSFHVFIKIVTLICALQLKVHVFLKAWIFLVSV